MKRYRFQDIYQSWTFADKEICPEEYKDDDYWMTNMLINRFNGHYGKYFVHGDTVNVDERMFWMFIRRQPGGPKCVDSKPRGTGQECKTLSASGVDVTTTFEHVRSAKISESKLYAKEYGKAAAQVLRLCKLAGIFGSKRKVIADSWFANLSLLRGLRANGLHDWNGEAR